MHSFTRTALAALVAGALATPVLAQSDTATITTSTEAPGPIFVPIGTVDTSINPDRFGDAIASSEVVLGAKVMTADSVEAGTVRAVETRADTSQRLIIEANDDLSNYLTRYSVEAPARLGADGSVLIPVTYAQLTAAITDAVANSPSVTVNPESEEGANTRNLETRDDDNMTAGQDVSGDADPDGMDDGSGDAATEGDASADTDTDASAGTDDTGTDASADTEGTDTDASSDTGTDSGADSGSEASGGADAGTESDTDTDTDTTQ